MLRHPAEFELTRTQVLPGPPEEVFSFFSDPRNLEAITPPWLRFRIVEAPARLERGSTLRYRLRLFAVPLRWRTEIADIRPPRSFTDVQVAGPYRLWIHTHRFAVAPVGTEVFDHVRYRIPGGPLASLGQRTLVGPWLDEIFAYRQERLSELFRTGR